MNITKLEFLNKVRDIMLDPIYDKDYVSEQIQNIFDMDESNADIYADTFVQMLNKKKYNESLWFINGFGYYLFAKVDDFTSRIFKCEAELNGGFIFLSDLELVVEFRKGTDYYSGIYLKPGYKLTNKKDKTYFEGNDVEKIVIVNLYDERQLVYTAVYNDTDEDITEDFIWRVAESDYFSIMRSK